MLKMKVYTSQLNEDAILDPFVDPDTEEKVVLTLPLEFNLEFVTPPLEQSPNILQRLWGRVKNVCKEFVHVNKRKDQQLKQVLRPQTRQIQQVDEQCLQQKSGKEQDLTMKTMDQATQATVEDQSPLSLSQGEQLSMVSGTDTAVTPIPVDGNAKATQPVMESKSSQTSTTHHPTQLPIYQAHLSMVIDKGDATATIKVDDGTKTIHPAMNNQATQAAYTSQSHRLPENGQCTSTANDSNDKSTPIPSNGSLHITGNPVITTQATQTTQTLQSPALSRKRPHSTVDSNCNKSTLTDSTSNNDNEDDSQHSTKRLCMDPNADKHIYYISATNSVTVLSPRSPFVYNSTISPRLMRCSDSDRVGTDPPTPVLISNDMNNKRKRDQIGDEDNDLEQQQITGSFENDSERLSKRQRIDYQEFVAFTIWILCYLVLFIFMMLLWLSFFESHPQLLPLI